MQQKHGKTMGKPPKVNPGQGNLDTWQPPKLLEFARSGKSKTFHELVT